MTLWRTFRWPLAIAFTSVVGLLSALLGDGWRDAVSWLTLGGLVAFMAEAWRRGR
jgi:hypothetical protein